MNTFINSSIFILDIYDNFILFFSGRYDDPNLTSGKHLSWAYSSTYWFSLYLFIFIEYEHRNKNLWVLKFQNKKVKLIFFIELYTNLTVSFLRQDIIHRQNKWHMWCGLKSPRKFFSLSLEFLPLLPPINFYLKYNH